MSSEKKQKTALSELAFDSVRYVELLGKIMGVSESLQNNPAQGLYPKEDLCSDHVLAALAPYSGPDGPLKVERIAFLEGRGNVIITYPGATDASVAFVGSHMDVVPANPETWKRDPFKLTVEGDELHGRGATDCLGHVALITEMMIELATKRPVLQRTVTAVLIANEENGVRPTAASHALRTPRPRQRPAHARAGDTHVHCARTRQRHAHVRASARCTPP